ncbi:MAG: RNA polymerase sigma factor [Tepidisphaeraceae bacterium]
MDWEGIVRDDGPEVWRAAYRLLGNEADADECFQEAFAAALEFSRRNQPVRHWRAFLIRLASAKAIDRLRQRISRKTREAPGAMVNVLADDRPNSRPSDQAEQAEQSARRRLALTHLPPKQADAFCLHCLEGYSYREVAEQLGASVDDVGVLLHRARAALRERIAWIISSEVGQSLNRIVSPSSTDEVSK